MPGTPIMPDPSRLRSAMLSTVEKPQTHLSRSMVEGEETKMRVPGKEGLKVLRMKMGMEAATAGVMVLGWMTLAPK